MMNSKRQELEEQIKSLEDLFVRTDSLYKRIAISGLIEGLKYRLRKIEEQ